jgi:hypothetical protein
MNCNISQIELYARYTKVSSSFLFNGFHGVFSYTSQQYQQQIKY